MSRLLEGQTAVVTGGASGFGRAISRTYARNGADVVVADVRETPREGGTPTHELIREETDRTAHHVECDVTDPEDLEVAVTAAGELGGIDVMVNNADIFRGEAFLDVREEDLQQFLDVNVTGVFFGAQVAAERMIASDGGSIIRVDGGVTHTG